MDCLSLTSRVLICVDVLVPLAGLAAIARVCNRVFRAGTSALTVALATAHGRLRWHLESNCI